MAGKKSYKSLLLEARELRGQAGLNAHKRASLLVKVFDDRDFRSEIGATDDYAAAEMLDSEIEDLCLSFLQLREILKRFPNEAEWSDGKLRTLYSRTCELAKADADAVSRTEGPARARRVVTIKELEQSEQARLDAEAATRRVEREMKHQADELEGLRRQNADLRMEAERLKGRIEELERLSGRLAAA